MGKDMKPASVISKEQVEEITRMAEQIVMDMLSGHDSCSKDEADQCEDYDDEYINSPCHYQSGTGLEAIDVIEEFKLNFNLGNVVKYVLRAGKKDDRSIIDLRKAFWYLHRELGAQEKKHRSRD